MGCVPQCRPGYANYGRDPYPLVPQWHKTTPETTANFATPTRGQRYTTLAYQTLAYPQLSTEQFTTRALSHYVCAGGVAFF